MPQASPAPCPHCRGTGYRPHVMKFLGVEAHVVVPCDCGAAQRSDRQLDRARIPGRYQNCDFENFDTGLYDTEPQAAAWNRSLEQAKLVVQAFARDFPVGSEAGLLLMGPCGVGKTHLGVAVLKQLAKRGHQCLFYDYRELLKQIQGSYNPENGATELNVLDPVLTAEVLLLDDLGASKPSEWARETLGHILNSRYNDKRVTLLTTNYLDGSAPAADPSRLPSGEKIPFKREDTLSERVGERIRSRLYEMCRTVEIISADYRRETRQASRGPA